MFTVTSTSSFEPKRIVGGAELFVKLVCEIYSEIHSDIVTLFDGKNW